MSVLLFEIVMWSGVAYCAADQREWVELALSVLMLALAMARAPAIAREEEAHAVWRAEMDARWDALMGRGGRS